jgi:transposase
MTVALDRPLPAADAGVMADGKANPDPEVPGRARRRTFTAKYKLEILAAYDAAEPGEQGAILRREGLYYSHIVEWRRASRGPPVAGDLHRREQQRPHSQADSPQRSRPVDT